MWEKTLRYPGHAEKVKVLRDLGFFSENSVEIEGAKIKPRQLSIKVLASKLWKPEVKDFVILLVKVSGILDGKPTKFSYYLYDSYDTTHKVTSMARTTAYPASIIAQFLLKKKIKTKGVFPPEKIGMNPTLFRMFNEELKKRAIKLKVTMT